MKVIDNIGQDRRFGENIVFLVHNRVLDKIDMYIEKCINATKTYYEIRT